MAIVSYRKEGFKLSPLIVNHPWLKVLIKPLDQELVDVLVFFALKSFARQKFSQLYVYGCGSNLQYYPKLDTQIAGKIRKKNPGFLQVARENFPLVNRGTVNKSSHYLRHRPP